MQDTRTYKSNILSLSILLTISHRYPPSKLACILVPLKMAVFCFKPRHTFSFVSLLLTLLFTFLLGTVIAAPVASSVGDVSASGVSLSGTSISGSDPVDTSHLLIKRATETRKSVKKYLKSINTNQRHYMFFSTNVADTDEVQRWQAYANSYKRRNGGVDFQNLRTSGYLITQKITSVSPNSEPFSLGMVDDAKGIIRVWGPPGGVPGSLWSEHIYVAIRQSMAKGRITHIYYMAPGAKHPSETVEREGADGRRYAYRMMPSGARRVGNTEYHATSGGRVWKNGIFFEIDRSGRPVVGSNQDDPGRFSARDIIDALAPPPRQRAAEAAPRPPAPRPQAPRPQGPRGPSNQLVRPGRNSGLRAVYVPRPPPKE